MTTEDVQGQLGRSAAVERELREQLAGLKAALAKSEQFREEYLSDTARLESELAAAKAEVAEARFRPMGDNHHNAAQCPYCGDPLRAAIACAEKAERERDEAKAERKRILANSVQVQKDDAARIAELEGALRGIRAAVAGYDAGRTPWAHDLLAYIDAASPAAPADMSAGGMWRDAAGRVRLLRAALARARVDLARAALAPNAPPKVDALPLPYVGTPGRQGCHPEGCPMPGLHTITSCNWLRQQLHRFGRHVPGCTLNGEDCSCGLLQMLAGRPLASTAIPYAGNCYADCCRGAHPHPAPHAEGEPGEER